jgi:L-amino acid N-acyltransferase YncA
MSNLNEIMWRNQGQVLTPELIHGILSGAAYKPFRGIDVAQFKPVEYKGFTFQAERFEDVVSEIAPLHRMQWQEVDERLQFIPFNPDYERYIQQDRDGGLIQFTVRRNGLLVGYCLVRLFMSMHTQTLSATEDSLYMHPDHRGGFTMIRFIKWMVECLASLGAKEVRVTSKVSNKSHVLMQRAGFSPCAMQLVRML